MQDKPVTLAVVTGAHGVTGEVRLKLFTEELVGLKRHKSFNGGALTLKKVRENKGGAIARFAEILDRNGAEALRGTELTVPRSALPPLEEGEYYHIDLIGRACVAPDGRAVGSVVAVHDFGAGDIVEIGPAEGRSFLVPLHAVTIGAGNAPLTVDADYLEEAPGKG